MNQFTFLALGNKDLGLESQTIEGIIYAPGLICTHCRAPLSAGLVIRLDGALEIMGETCAAVHGPGPWMEVIKSGRYYSRLSDLHLDAALPPHLRTYLRVASLNAQISPEDPKARRILDTLRAAGGEIIPAVKTELHLLIWSTGKVKDWLARRDQIVRLRLLVTLGSLLGKEETKINDLAQQAHYCGLTGKQNGMLLAIQQRYSHYLLPRSYQVLSQWPPTAGQVSIGEW